MLITEFSSYLQYWKQLLALLTVNTGSKRKQIMKQINIKTKVV